MKSKKMAFIALLIALTVLGSAFKIPAVIGSVALDVFPALFAGAAFGGAVGAVVGAIGHLLSALIAGMPLGPFHAMIAAEMALLVALFSFLYRKGKRWQAVVLFVLGNTFAAPLPFMLIMSKAFYLSIVPSLFLGSVINTLLSVILIPRIMNVAAPLIAKERQQL